MKETVRNARVWFWVGILTVVFSSWSAGQTAAQGPGGEVKIERYHVTLEGLPPFDCREIRQIGIELDPKKKSSKILDIQMVRQFRLDRPFHNWIQRNREGVFDPKGGTIKCLDASGATIMTFHLMGAWPRRWQVDLPLKGEKDFIPETVILRVTNMQMVY